MKKYSITQATNITSAIVAIVGMFGVTASAEDIQSCLNVGNTVTILCIVLVSAVVSYVNRHKKGDVTLGGFKK